MNPLSRLDLSAAARVLDRATIAPPAAEVEWTVPVDRYSFRTFAAPDGHVLEGGNVRTLGVHGKDGALVRTVTVPSGVEPIEPEFRPDGGFYVVHDEGVRCYSAEGEQLWDSPGRGLALASGPDGRLVVDSRTQMRAYGADGTMTWQLSHDGCYHDPAIRPDGVVVALEGDGTVVAVAPDGTEAWRNTSLKQVNLYGGDLGLFLAPPAPSGDGSIHLLTQHGEVRQLGPDGSDRWATSVGGRGDKYRPLVVDPLGTVYVTGGEQNGDLLGLSPEGQVTFRLEKAHVDGMCALPGGGVAVKGSEGVFGVGPDGRILWRFETDEPLSYLGTPSVSPDGKVHVCGKERLYSLEVPSAQDDPVDSLLEAASAEPAAGLAPELTEGDGWVLIGGVRLEQAR